MKTSYKNTSIETVLTNDHEPVYVVIIDGAYYTNGVADADENKAIENAKKVIDNQLK